MIVAGWGMNRVKSLSRGSKKKLAEQEKIRLEWEQVQNLDSKLQDDILNKNRIFKNFQVSYR